jgi:hypothetical protein
MKPFSRIAIPAAATAMLVLGVSGAWAGAQKYVKYTRPLGTEPKSGIEVLGPGGATRLRGVIDQITFGPNMALNPPVLSASMFVNAPSCGAPVVSTSADTFLVVWPTACVASGDFCVMNLSTTGNAIITKRSFYANATGDSIAPAVPTDFKPGGTGVPGSRPAPIAALMGLLALAGGVALMRRRRAAA